MSEDKRVISINKVYSTAENDTGCDGCLFDGDDRCTRPKGFPSIKDCSIINRYIWVIAE